MNPAHALALVLIPILSVGCAALATWSQRVRDLFFFLMVILAVLSERLEVNFLSEAWYRGTTRGIQISFPEILAFGLLVGTLLGRRRSEDHPRWFWPGSLGLMLLYLLYSVISVITAEPKLFGTFELSKIIAGLLVFLASAAYIRTRREWTILLIALGVVVGFEGLWALKQKFFNHLDRVAGTLDHPNSLSMYFCLTAPPLIALAYAGWTVRLRWFGGVCAMLAAEGLLLTVSRAGIPVFGFCAIGVFLCCATWKFSIRLILIRTSWVVGSIALVLGLWGEIARRYESATLTEEYLDPQVDGRGVYLRLAKNIASDHFFGVGLNNWSYHVSRTYGAQLGYRFEDYDRLVAVRGTGDIAHVFGDAYLAAPAHNLAALTLGELGVPGLLIFFLLWGRWFGMGLPFVFSPRGPPMRTLGVGLFFGICGIFGQSLTEWVLRQTPLFLTFHILLGALASLAYQRQAERKAGQRTTLTPVSIPQPIFQST